MSNVNKRIGSSAPGGVAKRRKSAAPQRPFVVAAKTSATSASAKPTVAAKPTSSVKTSAPAATAVRPPAAPPASSPKPATQATAARLAAESRDGSLLRVTGYALSRYVRNSWFAIDAVLLIAVFIFCYRSTFSTINFFTSAAFLLGALSAICAYGLVHGVVPPEDSLSLAHANGAARTAGGLVLAAVILRTVYCLIFVGLGLAFNRFDSFEVGTLLAGLLGLIVACAYVAAVSVCLSSPFAPRAPRVIALAVLMLGFASFNASGLLGGVLFIARIPLFPFIAPYRLAVAPTELLPWLGTLLLAPAAIVGMILLAGLWLRQSFAADSSEDAAR